MALNLDVGNSDLETAYAGMAEAWGTDASLAYGPMARHLVARAPVDLRGARALDAGAGSGVAGEALRMRGARVVAADREFDMSFHCARPAVTADVTALPFRDRAFDVVVAAFVVNHLPDPVVGLTELRRVTRRGGAVLASTFSVERAAAKGAVDEVAAAHGFVAAGVVRRPPGVRARRRRSFLGRGGVGGGRVHSLDGQPRSRSTSD